MAAWCGQRESVWIRVVMGARRGRNAVELAGGTGSTEQRKQRRTEGNSTMGPAVQVVQSGALRHTTHMWLPGSCHSSITHCRAGAGAVSQSCAECGEYIGLSMVLLQCFQAELSDHVMPCLRQAIGDLTSAFRVVSKIMFPLIDHYILATFHVY